MEPGAIIGRKYEIIAKIGEGGYGEVYKARHMIFDEPRAIKVVTAPWIANPEQAMRGFLSEARILRECRHPNIVTIEDVDFDENGRPFVVMEFVEGENLRRRLRRGKLDCREAVRICCQICDALTAAHQRGVLHRDLKPENVLLAMGSDNVVAKLIDFGIAKVTESAQFQVSGMPTNPVGTPLGTFDYMSPEQARGLKGKELDERSDIFALGLVLYEMVTGALAYSGGEFERMAQRLTNAPEPPRTRYPRIDLPKEIEAVLMRALSVDRAQRFSTAADFKRELDKAAGQRPSAAAPKDASGFRAAGQSEQGKAEPANQDYCLLAPELGLWVVADGEGPQGSKASYDATRKVAEYVYHVGAVDAAVLAAAFREANKAVRAMQADDPWWRKTFVSMTAIARSGETLFLAHTGVTKAFVCYGTALRCLTQEMEKLEPWRAVQNKLGAADMLEITAHALRLPPACQILLATAGLHARVAEDNLKSALNSSATVEEKVKSLIDLALADGGAENVTVVLLQSE
jgi:serine/threonine protein phosphatase PrpC/tRNA A-37 threonylcarbamoyl transferase component Bud32